MANNYKKLSKFLPLAMLTLAAALPPTAHAQVAAPASGNTMRPAASATGSPVASKLRFEVVSIRPSSRQFYLQGSDFLDPVSEAKPPQGGLFSWNIQLSWLINFAYSLRGPQVRRQAWEALPKWAQTDWYTIEARADENAIRSDVREMVRSMLEERFQFAGHLEKREGDVFLLEVIKPGLGLKPHPEGAPCTLASSVTDETKYPHAYPPYKGAPPRCGVFNRELSHGGERRFEMLDVTMQQIADSLFMPIPIVDHTGLQGHYDAVLDIAAGGLPRDPDPGDEIGAPPLPTALEKQLGLKLNKQKAQVDAFVIDHIEPPTPN